MISSKVQMFYSINGSASWLRKKCNKDSRNAACRILVGRGGVANLRKDIAATGTTAANRNMFIWVYRIQPCCMAACICPQTRHSLTHTCAPQRLQPLLIVCSCFAEKTEWLTVSSLVLSRPIPTPVWATRLPAVRSSLMPPAHG